MGITVRPHQRRHLHTIAANLLRDVSQDGKAGHHIKRFRHYAVRHHAERERHG